MTRHIPANELALAYELKRAGCYWMRRWMRQLWRKSAKPSKKVKYPPVSATCMYGRLGVGNLPAWPRS